jgi:hypothetical protein
MLMNPIALFVFICAIMIVVIAIYAWRQGSTEGARIFSLLMISMSIYIMGYSFELASLNIQSMLFWNKIQYIGILTFPTIYFVFASQYGGNNKWVTQKKLSIIIFYSCNLSHS